MKKILLLFCFNILTGALLYGQVTGCTDPQSVNYNPAATVNDGSCTYNATSLVLTQKASLSAPLLNESSGAAFLDGKLWTFNDSGNANDIYRIDTSNGTVLQTVDIANATNVDWEDMTTNSTHLFIGDFGNNNGDRQNLKIYRINKNDLGPGANSVNATIINFSYSDQTTFQSLPTNHNFDCESMIFFNDSIHLFSKNWVDLQTKHYVIPNVPGTHIAQYRETYNAGYLVTGATVQQFGVIALIGYLKTGSKPVSMSMIYDYRNNLFFNGNKRKFDLSTQLDYGQVEGIEFFNSSRLFLTNELFTSGATTIVASLRTLNISQYLPAAFLIPKPDAGFTASNITVCTNAFVDFTDNSSDNPVSWQWFFPGGNPSQSNLQNPQVQYSNAGNYNVTLIASNGAGSDTIVKTNYISVSSVAIPATPGPVSGEGIVCKNTIGNLYGVASVTNATSYNWTLPSGATISSGTGTNNIGVDFSGIATNGTICVRAVNVCGSSQQKCKSVKVAKFVPAKPSSINGSPLHCAGSTGAIFSCPVVTNAASYSWSVPSTAVITNGQGTNTITVSFLSGFTSGNVKVAAVNCLGSSGNRVFTVYGKPTTPGTINGPSDGVCAGSTNITYAINVVSGAAGYTWTPPSNASITSGQGTSVVTVSFNGSFVSGTLQVVAFNSCGISSSRKLAISSVPLKPPSVAGPGVVCAGQSGVTYTTAPVAGALSYQWVVPPGATIVGIQSSNTIIVNFGNSGGYVKVRAVNGCGMSAYRAKAITVNCREPFTGSAEFNFSIYPNPSASDFTIDLDKYYEICTLKIYDLTGKLSEYLQFHGHAMQYKFGETLRPGVYFVELNVDGRRKTEKVIKISEGQY